MKKYELVLMLNVQTQDSERKEFLQTFEDSFKTNILQKDDMGIKETTYDVKSIRWNNRIYYVSYLLDLDSTALAEIKKSLLYSTFVVRYEIFKMTTDQNFYEFEKLHKELQDIVDSWDKKRFWNKVSFLSLSENEKYINWKAIVILQKYLTRFGTIKSRKYTKNTVKTQKKLRTEIIRARTLWLLEFSR